MKKYLSAVVLFVLLIAVSVACQAQNSPLPVPQVPSIQQQEIEVSGGDCKAENSGSSITASYSDYGTLQAEISFSYLVTSDSLGGTLYSQINGEENEFISQESIHTRLMIQTYGGQAEVTCERPSQRDSQNMALVQGGVYKLFKGGKYSYYQFLNGDIFRLENEVGSSLDTSAPSTDLLLNYPNFSE